MKEKVVVVNIKDIEPIIKSKGYKVKRLITKRREGSSRIMLGVAMIDPGAAEPAWEGVSDEVYYVIKGKITLFYDDTKVEIAEGNAAFLPSGLKYHEINEGKEQCVYVYALTPPLE